MNYELILKSKYIIYLLLEIFILFKLTLSCVGSEITDFTQGPTGEGVFQIKDILKY